MFSLQVSLLLWSAGAFSAPVLPADDGGNFFQHRIVDHVDQLQQWRRRPPYEYVDSSQERGDPTPAAAAAVMVVPPPHLFRLPAPGGGVCLIVDENGAYHAVRDAFPPLGLPVSETGVVDSQVRYISYNGSTRYSYSSTYNAGLLILVGLTFMYVGFDVGVDIDSIYHQKREVPVPW